jgi:asparagine synthase (glutamine-hydrolysing)
MCGINAIIGLKGIDNPQGVVAKMNNAISHRGPDADGLWSDEYCTLGHRRLSIIDTSPAGNQPFHSPCGRYHLVFNGEIYNYKELALELASHFQFKTLSDTEVIIAAFMHWGENCVDHFIGMFAFVLWDSQHQIAYVFRDRLGVKPLYMAQKGNSVIISSEVRGILASDLVSKELRPHSIADFLRYQTVHQPNTILKEVNALAPGHLLKIQSGDLSDTCYWSLSNNVSSEPSQMSSQEIHQRIYELLLSSVELRMRADVPFGAFLSGGIDSSIIVGLMSRISDRPVETFAVTFDEKEFDESKYSSMVAKKFGTNHHEIRLSAKHFLDEVPDALNALDHPSGDGSNTYVVSEVTRKQGVKMALSGLGGDELFAGYDVFRRMSAIRKLRSLELMPLAMRRLSGNAMRSLWPSVRSEKIANLFELKKFSAEFAYPITRRVLTDRQIIKLFPPIHLVPDALANITSDAMNLSLPLLSKISIAEMNGYMLHVLLRDADQMSMAHALEVRVPFLDHRLVEFVLGVNDTIKFPSTPKKLLLDAVGDLLPHEVVHRPKMGFTFPWPIWMRGELRGFCEEGLQGLTALSVIRHHEVMHMWKLFLSGSKVITWSRIWPMVVLGHWVKKQGAYA